MTKRWKWAIPVRLLKACGEIHCITKDSPPACKFVTVSGRMRLNSTLFNKVENISSGSITSNQDKRALYDRWKKPGDKAQFNESRYLNIPRCLRVRDERELYFDRVRAFGILVRQSVAEEKFESFFVEYQRLYEFNRTLLHVRG